MTEYAVSTNLIGWVPGKIDLFGWPRDAPEAEVVDALVPGDVLIPKFSQTADYSHTRSQVPYVRSLCAGFGLDFEAELEDYDRVVAGGAGAVPLAWQVEGSLGDSELKKYNDGLPAPWALVRVSRVDFEHPLSTTEFLKSRWIPIAIAKQFKATAASGRHIQELPKGTVTKFVEAGHQEVRKLDFLRRLVLVNQDAVDPNSIFPESEWIPGDLCLIANENRVEGCFEILQSGRRATLGETIEIPPSQLEELFDRAKLRAVRSDYFQPRNAFYAAQQLGEFIRSGRPFEEIVEFGHFYDRYVLLDRKVSQARELAKRAEPDVDSQSPVDEDLAEESSVDGEEVSQIELDSLHGLTVRAVQTELDDVELPREVLAEAVTAIRSGKHVLLSGPPGTGKSRLASALCGAVVENQFDVATATADWTTFDTIGGYMPRNGGVLEFEPGIVLRCLQRGRWLVIDEINRADIDKAFGPLFTLLSQSDELQGGGQDVVLPFKQGEKNLKIVWAEDRESAGSPYVLTPAWRLIGTLNASDKASLFQLSFAFLRRFAVVDVPLPDEDKYRELFEKKWLASLPTDERAEISSAAMLIAFGTRQLGPAILKDMAKFVTMGLTETETAGQTSPYVDPVEAFLAAVRLYAVPQYEGATKSETDDLLTRLRGVWDSPPPAAWSALGAALDGVRLA